MERWLILWHSYKKGLGGRAVAFRFIHIGDVHFDTPFESRDPAKRSMLRQGIREAFERAVDIAINNKVDCVLIAGDLFDNDMLSFATEGFIVRQMERLKENAIEVFYATGNHDPGGAAYKARRIKWPSNVHVFMKARPQLTTVKNKHGESIGVIAACGHEGPRDGRNLAESFPEREGDLPWVGLLHTDVSGCIKGDEDRYAPCTLKDLQGKGYCYWALGHIHKRQVLCEEPDIIYSGNLMGRNPKEWGPKGIYLVEIENNRVKKEFIPVADVLWSLIKADNLQDSKSFEELKSRIKAAVLDDGDFSSGQRRLIRILLQGPTPLYDDLQSRENVEELERALEQELNVDGIEIKTDEIEPCAYPEDYRGGPHVLGEALLMLEELKENPEELLRMMDGKLAMDNSKWKDEDRLNYLKELLKGMDVEITSRLAGGIGK